MLDRLDRPYPLAAACAAAGIGLRTLERIFARELGADPATWRRQARLVKAVEQLAAGASVKQAAAAVGYQRSNPLVELFRSTLGATPKKWARHWCAQA
ncbi:MAG: helix-turn-helix domain-containing protein [Terriglobales bacterium]